MLSACASAQSAITHTHTHTEQGCAADPPAAILGLPLKMFTLLQSQIGARQSGCNSTTCLGKNPRGSLPAKQQTYDRSWQSPCLCPHIGIPAAEHHLKSAAFRSCSQCASCAFCALCALCPLAPYAPAPHAPLHMRTRPMCPS